MFVSEIYAIEDCLYYNTTEVTLGSRNSSKIYDSNLELAFPSKCEISFDYQSVKSGNGGQHRYFIMPKTMYNSSTTQPNYGLWSDHETNQNKIGFGVRDNNSTVSHVSDPTTIGNWDNAKWVKDGTSVKVYYNDALKTTQTLSWINNYSNYCFSMMIWSAQGTSHLKNVKVKSL